MESREEWLLSKEQDLEKCARCGVEGIPSEVSDDGDEAFTAILDTQHNGDSKYAKEYLCNDCMMADDYAIYKWNRFAEDHCRHPKPWEGV